MNKFENGLEHVKIRISRIEDEIYNITESRERNIIEKNKLEDEISDISGIEQLLSELYDELYRISEFHEANNLLITQGFELELRKIFKEYYSNKLKCLNSMDFLKYDQIKSSYQNSRSSLIKKLENDSGGDFLKIDPFNNIIKKIIKSNEKIFLTIFQIESFYKILLCFLNTDFLIWDPFSYSIDTILPSFLSIINDVFKQNGEIILNNDLFNTQKLIERFYLQNLMNYICEIVKIYWTPLYFKETENLVESISYIKNSLEIEMPEIMSEFMEKLQNSFNSLISEYLSNSDIEYKFVILLLNWGTSVRIVTKLLKIKKESTDVLLNNSIINFFKNITKDCENENLRKLLYNTEIDTQKMNDYSVHDRKLDSNTILNPETIGLVNINEAIYQITNSYKLDFPNKKYTLNEIILEIVSNHN
ncbi:uncharacterized protein cubi_02053 [Cryptosporidium ubiquitum]|uniref:Uncharacterized protein n=1 Tax=Cryptosporidium ubiquitum TaxID=857276 RepID=A0A1J4MRA6_9CRYT|nr:uncharacterized protein cubi_02053 [Cryptosporidium ubiquitum]OII75532.1 hypothetical protein cubi_02053 [Cryptosporidium ubiquitum]